MLHDLDNPLVREFHSKKKPKTLKNIEKAFTDLQGSDEIDKAGFVIFEIITGKGSLALSGAVYKVLDEKKASRVIDDYWADYENGIYFVKLRKAGEPSTLSVIPGMPS